MQYGKLFYSYLLDFSALIKAFAPSPFMLLHDIIFQWDIFLQAHYITFIEFLSFFLPFKKAMHVSFVFWNNVGT